MSPRDRRIIHQFFSEDEEVNTKSFGDGYYKRIKLYLKRKNETSNEEDTGSSEVQIGLLTDKISNLSNHFKNFKKDKHSTLGLTKSVNKRKKLLAYLKKRNIESYQKVIKQLNLRK